MSFRKVRYRTYFLCILFQLHRCLTVSTLPESSQTGWEDTSIEAALRYAVSEMNKDTKLNQSNTLEWEVQHSISCNICHTAKKGGCDVLVKISPTGGLFLRRTRNKIDARTISIMQPDPDDFYENKHQTFVKMYPDPSSLNQAYIDIIQYFHWNTFCIIYGDEKDILQLQTILTRNFNPNVQFMVRQAKPTQMLEVLKYIKHRGINKLVVHLSALDTHTFLRTALLVGMIDNSYHFLLTNLDIEAIPLDDFKHNNLNLVGFRMINLANDRTREMLSKMTRHQRSLTPDSKVLHSAEPPVIKINAAIMYDAVTLFAEGLHEIEQDEKLSLDSDNETCDATSYRRALYEYMHSVETDGLTGKVTFDEGRRSNFHLDILELGSMGLTKTSPYVMLKGDFNGVYEGFCIDILEEISSLVGIQYKIKLVADGKYGALRTDGKWMGMVGELVDKKADLSVAPLTIMHAREQVIDFTVPFQKFGITILFKRPRRESIGPFSFLQPLDLHIWIYIMAALIAVTIIMFFLAKLSPYERNTPCCHNPWKPKSTVSHATGNHAEIGCSEFDNRRDSRNPDSPTCSVDLNNINLGDLEDQAKPGNYDDLTNFADPYHQSRFTLSDCFWFSVGTLMQQGSDINPRALSTRMVGITWWFFALIIITSYTANLAAFLTVDRMKMPIQNAEDLSKQTQIRYGTILGSPTEALIRTSKVPTFQRMRSFISQHPSVMVSTNKEGIEKVQRGNYAFLMDSKTAEYFRMRICDLMVIGGHFSDKSYGIGTQNGSPYRERISLAILHLQETGVIQQLEEKWWNRTGGCRGEKQEDMTPLGLEHVGGVFLVLIIGLILSALVAVGEFVWRCSRHYRKP